MSLKILKQYQNIINQIIDNFFINTIPNPFIKEMCQHAMMGGKRLRSAFALNIYITMLQHLEIFSKIDNLEEDLNINNIPNDIVYFIICVELLHTTSLILDDLPSMDNDNFRRGVRSIHNKYGKSNANILVSYCMSQSFVFFHKSLNIWKNDISDIELIQKISRYIIYFKNIFLKEMMIATEGQYLDIFPEKSPLPDNIYWECYGNSKDISLNMVTMKTAPFYMIPFCGGYLLARIRYIIKQHQQNKILNNDVEIIMERTKKRFDKLREASYQFSYAFQISDDILDMEKDSNKDNCIINNYPLMVGKKKAYKKMTYSLNVWKKSLSNLFLDSPLILEIYNYLPQRTK